MTTPRLRLAMAWMLLVGALVGCANRPMPAWNLSAPGWTVNQSPAVWCPHRGGPELVGELLVAHRTDGSRLVQFSKQGIPMIVARADAEGWEIRSPFDASHHSARGSPPLRALWFQIDASPPASMIRPPWSLERRWDGSWILEDRATGERLEVVP